MHSWENFLFNFIKEQRRNYLKMKEEKKCVCSSNNKLGNSFSLMDKTIF